VPDGDPPSYARSTRDRVYWLRECRGFTVVAEGRRLGVVDDVLFGPDTTVPEHLLVRTGFLARRRVRIPAAAIDDIDPRRRRLVLREGRRTARAESRGR
jgi:hypothetical protein